MTFKSFIEIVLFTQYNYAGTQVIHKNCVIYPAQLISWLRLHSQTCFLLYRHRSQCPLSLQGGGSMLITSLVMSGL